MQKADYTEKVLDEINIVKSKYKNGIFLLGGDFNLPDIIWKANCITGKQGPGVFTDDCKPAVHPTGQCAHNTRGNIREM